uniref:sensor N-terminal transmembrane domain-containing protein n=2 Tax=Brevundimonas TaxID=41275 RepID=UPI00257FAF2D
MASATDTAKADLPGREAEEEPHRRPLFRFGGSRLGGFILALNLLSLLILFGGALLLNEWSKGLIQARQESLKVQAELLGNVLGQLSITRGEPTPELDVGEAARWLRDNFVPEGQRVRLYDINGLQVIDSYQVTENIPGQALPPARPAGSKAPGDLARVNARRAEQKDAAEREVTAEVE